MMMLVLLGWFGTSQVSLPGPLVDRDLVSSVLSTRVTAVERLLAVVDGEPDLLEQPAIQDSVILALQLENDLIEQNLTVVAKGSASLLPEGYGEHYSRVLDLANRLRSLNAGDDAQPDPRRGRLLRTLVRATYNPDSAFAQDLAREGETIAPDVVALLRSGNGPARWNAYALVANMLKSDDRRELKRGLSAKSRAQFRLAARDGLQDPAPDVRRFAVAAVVAAKDKDAIPLLRRMAETDPDDGRGARNALSVRRLAGAAAAELAKSR